MGSLNAMRTRQPDSLLKENGGVGSNNKQSSARHGKFGRDVTNKSSFAPVVKDLPGSVASIDADCGSEKKVQPYVGLSLEYLLSKSGGLSVRKDYMLSQPYVNEKMRAVLVDWLVDVSQKFKLLPQSLFMSVSIVDRFLSRKTVERARLQLLGIASVLIVGKYEEIYPPTLKDYVSVCDNIYSSEEIVDMESEILIELDFDLALPVSFVVLEFFRCFIHLEEKEFAFCQFLLESALLDLEHLDYSPSELAAGSIFLVHRLFKKPTWQNNEENVTKVSLPKVKTCAKTLYSILARLSEQNLTAISCKFASPKYFEVARYRIEKIKPSAE